jgi:pyruvate dehydrogenase E1 component
VTSRPGGFCWVPRPGARPWPVKALQHQDGHSHILALPNPSLLAYDPAFAFEIAVIVREGLRRMLEEGENLVYYLTITNEFYPMPEMPSGAEAGILNGLYKFSSSSLKKPKARAHLLGSGAIFNECLKARNILESDYGVAADLWSVTSYKNLYWDAQDTDRWNHLNPDKKPRPSFLQQQTADVSGVFVAASDYLKALPETIARHLPGPLVMSWAPTATAAVKPARPCATFSRWTPGTLPLRPFPPWPEKRLSPWPP